MRYRVIVWKPSRLNYPWLGDLVRRADADKTDRYAWLPAVHTRMKEKAREFVEAGSEIYRR